MSAATDSKKQLIAQRVRELAARNGGTITPEIVVQDAMEEDSPLHDRFPWDVKVAAHAHWIDCARRIIREVQYEVQSERILIEAPAYVRNPRAAADEQSYIAVTAARSDKDLAREVLIQEFSRVASCLRRARALAALFDLEAQVDSLLGRVSEMRREIDGEADAVQ